MQDEFSAAEVCRISGLNYRAVDYLIRTRQVELKNPNPGYGHNRKFDKAAVQHICLIAEVRRQIKALEEQVRTSRQEQGLSETVSDSDVVRELAGMLRRGVE
jgi:hypothetical protein